MLSQAAIKFYLHCSQTRKGETVKVTGNRPELGNWNVANALSLFTSAEDYPIWQAGIFVQLDQLQDVEYKYVIVKDHLDASAPPIWENFEGNRALQFSSGRLEECVQDVFNERSLARLEINSNENDSADFGGSKRLHYKLIFNKRGPAAREPAAIKEQVN